MKTFILIFLAMLALVFGDSPCQFPKNFRASQSIKTYSNTACIAFSEYGDAYVDSDNQRTRVDLFGQVPGVGPLQGTVWSFYKTKKQFFYDDTKNTCHISPLTDKFPPVDFPPNAVFFNDMIFGTQPIDVYAAKDSAQGTFTVFGTTPGPHCVPVFIDAFNSTNNFPLLEEGLTDLVESFPSSAFDLPSACTASDAIVLNGPHPKAPRLLGRLLF